MFLVVYCSLLVGAAQTTANKNIVVVFAAMPTCLESIWLWNIGTQHALANGNMD